MIAGRAGRFAAARSARVGCAALVAALLSACAAVPPAVVAPAPGRAYVDTPFAAAGRLSARHGLDAVAVHFVWSHRPPHDDLAVTSPLGQTVAELSGDASVPRVEARSADGRRAEAPDWTTLTEQALGFPLPVSGLAAWIRGSPHPGTRHTLEADPEGRVSLLRQDGWEIVYDYPDAAAREPQRLRISYPDVEIRVVVDRWG